MCVTCSRMRQHVSERAAVRAGFGGTVWCFQPQSSRSTAGQTFQGFPVKHLVVSSLHDGPAKRLKCIMKKMQFTLLKYPGEASVDSNKTSR